jgi:hypothetical protein
MEATSGVISASTNAGDEGRAHPMVAGQVEWAPHRDNAASRSTVVAVSTVTQ